jgi:hypothetical protein
MQEANWELVREMRDEFVHALLEEDSVINRHVNSVYAVGNAAVIEFEDGSEITWTPTITRDAG